MGKFLTTALANMGSSEPHSASLPRPNPERRSKKSASQYSLSVNKFFSRAFSNMGAPEAYSPISARQPRKDMDKFYETLQYYLPDN
jgi:hypothetical protein